MRWLTTFSPTTWRIHIIASGRRPASSSCTGATRSPLPSLCSAPCSSGTAPSCVLSSGTDVDRALRRARARLFFARLRSAFDLPHGPRLPLHRAPHALRETKGYVDHYLRCAPPRLHNFSGDRPRHRRRDVGGARGILGAGRDGTVIRKTPPLRSSLSHRVVSVRLYLRKPKKGGRE